MPGTKVYIDQGEENGDRDRYQSRKEIMRAISMLLTVFLVVGPTVLVCGCTGTQWGGDRNQTAAGSSQSGDMMRIDEILAQDPDALPGRTSNHCYFCWHVLTRGLVDGVPGGGGQVGNWTGQGELIQLGRRET